MGTLKDLTLSRGFTLERAAAQVGVAPMLLLRVDQRRQALRMDVVRALATLLAESVGTVEVACGRVVESTDARWLNPYPPVPILGDKIEV
jgi:hypothetical protein